jgi:uncharacterized protein YodC (DUF2158 family)
MLCRDVFPAAGLRPVDTSRAVVLNSGGPLMDVLSVTDGSALCEWRGDDGKVGRGRFPVNCLSRLVPFSPNGTNGAANGTH